MRVSAKIKLIAACAGFTAATQAVADSKRLVSTGSVKSKVSDPSVWTAAAKAYAETVKQLQQAKEGKQ